MATATLNDANVLEQNLTVVRGDERALQLELEDIQDETAFDLTGSSVKLVVDTDAAPSDTSNNLFTITGVIATPASGIVTFTPSSTDSDQEPNTYFYDIQVTLPDSRNITVAKGQWIVVADIADAGA